MPKKRYVVKIETISRFTTAITVRAKSREAAGRKAIEKSTELPVAAWEADEDEPDVVDIYEMDELEEVKG
jgi:hypothetical protein